MTSEQEVPVLLTADEADIWLRNTSGDVGSPDGIGAKVRRLIRFIASGAVPEPRTPAPELPPPDHEKDLLTVGHDGLQHDASGSRSSQSAVPLTEGGPELIKCWCGAEGTYEQLFDDAERCGGSGMCLCGGDNCVCHNHGECGGCADCEGTYDDEQDGLP